VAFTAPVLDIDDIVRRMNHFAAKQGEPERWDRWSVRKLLEAGGVPLIQKGKRCKIYVMLADLRASFPTFWDSLLDAEALEQAHDQLDA
jgi:hypothetical protein